MVIQNGDRWEEQEKEVSGHSTSKARTSSPIPPIPSKMGTASNPNRAEMPKTARKTSYDPVSLASACVLKGDWTVFCAGGLF